MKPPQSIFVILISTMILITCRSEGKVEEYFTFENDVPILNDTIKTLSPKNKTTQVSEISLSTIRDSLTTCILQNRNYSIPPIRSVIGDTINIRKTQAWITKPDDEIRTVIRRGEKFFQINESRKIITIGFLEDEGEYVAIYAYSIDKESCEILGTELLAEETAWENGYKETFSIFEENSLIRREKRTSSKDWGDYTKWSKGETITMISFDEEGKMVLVDD